MDAFMDDEDMLCWWCEHPCSEVCDKCEQPFCGRHGDTFVGRCDTCLSHEEEEGS